jgi:hypothetical protein
LNSSLTQSKEKVPAYASKGCTAFRIYVGYPFGNSYERNQGVDGKMISN